MIRKLFAAALAFVALSGTANAQVFMPPPMMPHSSGPIDWVYPLRVESSFSGLNCSMLLSLAPNKL